MKIEVITDEEFDIESKNIQKSFFEFSSVKSDVKVTKCYEVIADEKEMWFKKIANEILSDPVVESFRIIESNKRFLKGYKILVKISFKKGVSDVVGESVKDIISKNGYSNSIEVRSSRIYYFSKPNRKKIIDFIKENFANELIHTIDVIQI